jgi:hypothetical protein
MEKTLQLSLIIEDFKDGGSATNILILNQHRGGVQHQIGLIPLGAEAFKRFYLNLFSNRNQLNGDFE